MSIAFVVMQIGDSELDRLFETVIQPAIESVGLQAKRVDRHNEGGLLKSEDHPVLGQFGNHHCRSHQRATQRLPGGRVCDGNRQVSQSDPDLQERPPPRKRRLASRRSQDPLRPRWIRHLALGTIRTRQLSPTTGRSNSATTGTPLSGHSGRQANTGKGMGTSPPGNSIATDGGGRHHDLHGGILRDLRPPTRPQSA